MEVMTTLAVAKNDRVVIEEIGGAFRAEAEVLDIHVGADNVPRLSLKFLDAEAAAGMRDLLKRNGIFE